MRHRMQHPQEVSQHGHNPYGLPMEPSATVQPVFPEVFNRMTTEAMMNFFLTYLLHDKVRLLLCPSTGTVVSGVHSGCVS